MLKLESEAAKLHETYLAPRPPVAVSTFGGKSVHYAAWADRLWRQWNSFCCVRDDWISRVGTWNPLFTQSVQNISSYIHNKHLSRIVAEWDTNCHTWFQVCRGRPWTEEVRTFFLYHQISTFSVQAQNMRCNVYWAASPLLFSVPRWDLHFICVKGVHFIPATGVHSIPATAEMTCSWLVMISFTWPAGLKMRDAMN